MFTILDSDFKTDFYGNQPYLENWPMLYILENSKNAYVGQTNSISKRMAQHKQSDSKQEFTKAHFIYYEKSNQSATFDYESQLISLMAADGKFILTNRNCGLSGLNYYKKDEYNEDFKQLWRDLQQKGLVVNTIEELQQSDLFKYSPFKQLSNEQRYLVSEITENLKHSLDRKIVIEGMPGSGKTILAIYLFKLLRESPEFANLKIGFLVPPTSLRKTIQSVFKTIHGLSIKDVIGPNDVVDNDYDIIFVDESHRLKKRMNLPSYSSYDSVCNQLGLPTDSTQLDWVLKKSRCCILFYDKKQLIFPQGLKIHELIDNDLTDRRMTARYTLYSQMRCMGGLNYLTDLANLFQGKLNSKIRHNEYELAIIDDFNQFNSLNLKKESELGLSRIIAGYAWNWNSKNDKNRFDIELDGVKKQWNSTTENWVHSSNAINEVGCIHSIQGYDLNYGFVIIGNDLKYDPISKKLFVDKNNYFDTYGKNNTSTETLEEFIKNIYYVLMTRGIKGTYLYICNPELKKYMKQYIDTYSEKDNITYYNYSNNIELKVAEDTESYGDK